MNTRYAILAAAATLWPSLSHANCTEPVTQAFEKLRASKSFRMETSIINAQGKLNMTVDYIPPDRMHQKIRLNDQPQDMEMIVIGQQAWSNQGQGWVPLPEKFSTEVANQVKTTLAGVTKVEANYNCGQEETIEGKKVAAYEAELQPPPVPAKIPHKPTAAEGPPNKQTLYVDKDSGLPVRNIVRDGKDPNKPLFDGWFRTSVAISIEPPDVKK